MSNNASEQWGTRWGAILAVAGSAVGLGNFLRFPGLVAEYGGGAFMIAYAVAFLVIGLPICWAEWTLGRMGGLQGAHAAPAILGVVTGRPGFRYFGVIGVIIPVAIFMFYVIIEAWCLAYAVNYLRGALDFRDASGAIDRDAAQSFFVNLTGVSADGSAFRFDWEHIGGYAMAAFILNFVLIYRGVSKGIEWFCRWAMPLLIVVALIVLVRVLTLGTPDADHPERSIGNGLGFLWNPEKVMLQSQEPETGVWQTTDQLFSSEAIRAAEEGAATAAEAGRPTATRVEVIGLWAQLANPSLWNAAAGQIFFSLSVGFGVIITYASYLRRRDDVVLSAMTASSANQFCEVAIGGLLSIPAGVAFFGTAFMLERTGTFSVGFNVLPLVFSSMAGGGFFGFLFFTLLFLAAVTSSISMLQPGIAFLEESLGITRQQSVAILGLITAMGAGFVLYFSGDLKSLDTIDYWVSNLLMVSLGALQIIIFSWVVGVDRSLEAAHVGASVRIPGFYRWVMKWVSPAFLVVIFAAWLAKDVLGLPYRDGEAQVSGYTRDLFVEPNVVAWMSVALVMLLGVFITLLVPRQPKAVDRIEEG